LQLFHLQFGRRIVRTPLHHFSILQNVMGLKPTISSLRVVRRLLLDREFKSRADQNSHTLPCSDSLPLPTWKAVFLKITYDILPVNCKFIHFSTPT